MRRLPILLIILLPSLSVFCPSLFGYNPLLPLQDGKTYELSIAMHQGSFEGGSTNLAGAKVNTDLIYTITYQISVKRLDSAFIELIATWRGQRPGGMHPYQFKQDRKYTFPNEVGQHDSVRIVVDETGKIISGDPLLLDTITRHFILNLPPQNFTIPYTLDVFNPENVSHWLAPQFNQDGSWQRTLQIISDNAVLFNHKLINRFTYLFKPFPEQHLSIDFAHPNENWNVIISRKNPKTDGQTFQIDQAKKCSYAVTNPTFLILDLSNKSGTSVKYRLYARPGDQWKISWDEKNQPVIQTPYDPWNTEQLPSFWKVFRKDRFYDQMVYFRELQDKLGHDSFIQWMKNQYQYENKWLQDNPPPDPDAYQLLASEIYFTQAMVSQFNLYSPFSNQDADFRTNDTAHLYRTFAEETQVYDQFIEAYLTNKFHSNRSNYNPLNSNPSFQPLTSFYYAIEHFQDYARNYLMLKYARQILSNTLFDLQTCEHVLQIFQDMVPDPNRNNELQSLYTKRKGMEKGEYFKSLKVLTENGEQKIQDVISGPLLIFNQYHDTHLNPKLILNIDKEALTNMSIVILSKKENPELATEVAKHTGIPLANIFVLQPARGETIMDTLYFDTEDLESSIFSLLLDKNQKIYYAGPNRFAPIYSGLQELNRDLKFSHSNRMQNILVYGLSTLVLFLVVVLVIWLREQYIHREYARKYQQLQLKWQALTGQLNPHFLFNSLASIREMIDQQRTEQASDYIQTFSNFLRGVLKANRSKRIPLARELEFAENYLWLERIRSPFEVKWEIDPAIDLENTEIPPMILQPYLENAVKHGISGKSDGMIGIQMIKKNQVIHITISDNGKGINMHDQETGVGLSLGKERLETLYENRAKVKYTPANAHLTELPGTKIQLWIPIE